jgi:hypothetical protein
MTATPRNPRRWKNGACPLTPDERAQLLASIDGQIAEIDARRGPKTTADGPRRPVASAQLPLSARIAPPEVDALDKLHEAP